MVKLLKYLNKKEWAQAFICLVFVVCGVWLDLRLPDYMSEITTIIQTPGSTIAAVWSAGGNMLLCALGSLLASVIVGYFAARIAASFSRRLRSLLFSKVESFSMEEMSRFSTASLITRSTNDITQVQTVVTMGLQLVVKAPIMAIWAIFKIAGKGFQWTLATGIALAILVTVMVVLMAIVTPKFKKVQSLTDDVNRVTRETLTGLRVIRAYNVEDYQEAKFEEVNDALTKTQMFTGRAMSVMSPMMSTVMNGLSLAIYLIGAVLIGNAGAMDKLPLFSNMVVFSSYAMQIIMAFLMLVMMFVMLPRATVSANRIHEVLDTEPTIQDGTVTASDRGKKGEVAFEHVSFRYPGASEYVLRDINFTAKQGETVAFIGSTGSGKSTLINLVPRFFDATEGRILIDGVDVRAYTQETLYNKLGYVPQRAVLFQGTVESNVAYGDNGGEEYTEQNVKEAVRIAQGSEFVEKMDEQYGAHIAQGGANVSGGQKQRIAIARAICREPEIYIFDDSFSALDYKTDRVLRSALKQETGGVTSLIVAQRIGTIMDADQIIVLDEGRIVGQGTHKELLKSCDVYRQIAMSQLSEEELIHA